MSTAPAPAPGAPERPRPSVGAGLLLDYGPLLIFFLTNFLAPVPSLLRIFVATGVFMVAMIVSMLISQIRYRYISPMLWFSGIMVVIFGGLTLWLHDETFIKIKPTIYYATVSALLLFGLVTGRNLLKMMLGTAYPGLRERGWQILTRNWIVFFAFMAVANEAVWRNTTTDFWAASKLWLFIPATFIFIAAHLPMLLRHGLGEEEAPEPPLAPPE
ncbi:MAG TPA: inner membrane-spanning protein YciB [Allosphingosinicella sp.]|nr:inner membrane-spanning protein YciB [Allosphingosinicella sp.]